MNANEDEFTNASMFEDELIQIYERVRKGKLRYHVMYHATACNMLVAGFVHESDAETVCEMWNQGRNIYFVHDTEMDNK